LDERGLKEVVASVIGRDATLDDCAVLPIGDEYLVATTDMLHESTDFPRGMTEREIGWMGAAVTLSDIAAMGARPSSSSSPSPRLSLPPRRDPRRCTGLLQGIRRHARRRRPRRTRGTDRRQLGDRVHGAACKEVRRPARRPGGSRRGPREGAGGHGGIQRLSRIPLYPEARVGEGWPLPLPVFPP